MKKKLVILLCAAAMTAQICGCGNSKVNVQEGGQAGTETEVSVEAQDGNAESVATSEEASGEAVEETASGYYGEALDFILKELKDDKYNREYKEWPKPYTEKTFSSAGADGGMSVRVEYKDDGVVVKGYYSDGAEDEKNDRVECRLNGYEDGKFHGYEIVQIKDGEETVLETHTEDSDVEDLNDIASVLDEANTDRYEPDLEGKSVMNEYEKDGFLIKEYGVSGVITHTCIYKDDLLKGEFMFDNDPELPWYTVDLYDTRTYLITEMDMDANEYWKETLFVNEYLYDEYGVLVGYDDSVNVETIEYEFADTQFSGAVQAAEYMLLAYVDFPDEEMTEEEFEEFDDEANDGEEIVDEETEE